MLLYSIVHEGPFRGNWCVKIMDCWRSAKGRWRLAPDKKVRRGEYLYFGHSNQLVNFDKFIWGAQVVRCQSANHRGYAGCPIQSGIGGADAHIDNRLTSKNVSARIHHRGDDRITMP